MQLFHQQENYYEFIKRKEGIKFSYLEFDFFTQKYWFLQSET
jgi:hypothetical protein